MPKKTKKFPKKILVYWADTNGDEESFLLVAQTPDDVPVESGTRMDIGVYRLQSEGTAYNETIIEENS